MKLLPLLVFLPFVSASAVPPAYLKASNTQADDNFGYAVAVSGDTMVVGAPGEDGGGTGVNPPSNESRSGAGAVYVFIRSGGVWTQQAYLKASNADAGDFFGGAVAISGDTIVVGAYGERSSTTGVNPLSNESAVASGAAYVFVRSGGVWTQQAWLKSSNSQLGDFFGRAVAVSGETIAVGADGEDSNGSGPDNNSAGDSGAAYIFTRNAGVWTQQAYAKAANVGTNDFFGLSVGLSGDTLVAGAYGEDTSGTGANPPVNNSAFDSGAAYVFVRNGEAWTQQAMLKASNTQQEDYFGWSVAVSGDTVIAGAYGEDGGGTGVNSPSNENVSFAGAAYVFRRNGTSWSQEAYLKAANTGLFDSFGHGVALSGDIAVVGAYKEHGSGTGANPPSDEAAPSSGAAYTFRRSGTVWTPGDYLKASNTDSYDEFGRAVAAADGLVVAGAVFEDGGGTGVDAASNESASAAGAAYVFESGPPPPAPEIVVEQPAGTDLTDGAAAVDFGSARTGSGLVTKTFTVKNTGAADLTGLAVTKDGPNATEFTLNTTGFGATVAPGGSTSFSVTFAPAGDGVRAAALHIASNDTDEPSFDIALTGTGTPPPGIPPLAMFKASNTGIGDNFGSGVAVSGDTMVVGAPQESGSGTGVNPPSNEAAAFSGAAYVYVRNGTAWTFQAYLKASDTEPADRFGSAVAISGDTIVVGAPGEDGGTGDEGAAYVFVRSGGAWTHQAKFKASNAGAVDFFGLTVAISGDTIVIGAPFEDSSTTGVNPALNDSSHDTGAAYVFTRGGTVWTQQAVLKASNTGMDDYFGGSVAVSGDVIAAGAPGEDSSGTGVNSPVNDDTLESAGAAYVFTRSGGVWTQQAWLKPSTTRNDEQFGISVAASGETVAVGSPYQKNLSPGINPFEPGGNSAAASSGAAYVFVRSGGVWSQQAWMKASNPELADQFARSLALSGDVLVAGAPGEDSSGAGVNPADNNGASSAGAAYVFTRNGTTWQQQAYLKAPNSGANDEFGQAVAISGELAVIGAPKESGGGTGYQPPSNESAGGSGAAYLFSAAGLSKLKGWRKEFFGITDDTADLGDYDGDGFPNLIEFAFGMNPVAAGGGVLPQPQINGGNFTLAFTQPAGVDSITYGVEYSLALAAGPWVPLTDAGTAGHHTFSISTDGKQKLFLRLTAAPQ